MKNYFRRSELVLWLSSVGAILISFVIFDRVGWLTLASALVGVTSLIFAAKGNPVGQVLMIVFSLLYGAISYSRSYYGEMITYLGMTAPMAVFSLIAWLRHPFKGNKSEVEVMSIGRRDILLCAVLTAAVTVVFYFILVALNTPDLTVSTISVSTSFAAVYLTFCRSEWFAVAYAANDVVLIVLWSIATVRDISSLSVMITFVAFLANDIYGFISWQRMRSRQRLARESDE